MAEVQRVTVRMAPQTYTLLQQFCQARECSQSEAAESAIRAYVTPRPDGAPSEALLARVEAVHQKLDALLALMETLVPKPAPAPERPKIATYDEMYAPDDATPTLPEVQAAAPLPALPPPRGWRRWFLKEQER